MNENQLREIAALLACPEGDNAVAFGDKMAAANAFIYARAIERLSAQAGQHIVEVGPGNGSPSIPIVEALGPGGHYTGLELSGAMSADAEARLQTHGGAAVSIQNVDARAAEIAESTVDAVLAINLLYFIEDDAGFFATLAWWLRPGGRLVIGVRTPKSLNAMPFTRFGFQIRSLEEITARLKSAGFGRVISDFHDEGVNQLGDLEVPVETLVITATKS